ncbi:MAG: FHA domain-containing protein [Clostridia bacterium]|nr:FHA domain-containing protein [Clostridia bacterium]
MKVFKKSGDLFAGSITGISGAYEGAIFRLDPGENIIIGRDPKTSHIVVDEGCELVSRTHCTVKGNSRTGYYSVTDHSKNGTFVDGERLPKGVTVFVPKGAILYIGDRENTFKLN